MPLDPNNPPHYVQWFIKPDQIEGIPSLLFYIDGSQDDGTIWIQKPFMFRDVGRPLKVTLSFWLYSIEKSEGANAEIVTYFGLEKPVREEQFDIIGVAQEVAGWKKYSVSKTIYFPSANPTLKIWLALGLNVVWETELLFWISGVKVEKALL